MMHARKFPLSLSLSVGETHQQCFAFLYSFSLSLSLVFPLSTLIDYDYFFVREELRRRKVALTILSVIHSFIHSIGRLPFIFSLWKFFQIEEQIDWKGKRKTSSLPWNLHWFLISQPIKTAMSHGNCKSKPLLFPYPCLIFTWALLILSCIVLVRWWR